MTDFAQTMRDWQRMCKYFDEHYNEDCCHICPIQNCGAIWEMGDITNWEEFEEIISTWAAEHPEPQQLTYENLFSLFHITISPNGELYFDKSYQHGTVPNEVINLIKKAKGE